MRATRYLIPLAVVAALVAGCDSKGGSNGTGTTTPPTTAPADNGVAALSATEIAAKAEDALKKASSVHIKGSFIEDKETFVIDLKITDKKDGTGSITLSGQTVQIKKIGADIYIKGDEAFWKQFAGDEGAALGGLLAGKWLKAPSTDAQVGALSIFFGLADQVFNDSMKNITKGETKVINGVSAIALVDPDPENGGTLWIATQGQPYPVHLDSPDKSSGIDFLDYGAAVDTAAPPASEVLDLSKLK